MPNSQKLPTPRAALAPVKRLLNRLKPKPTLGKRPRSPSPATPKPASERKRHPPLAPTSIPCPIHPTPPAPTPVAIQTSSPTSNSIIITTLPFPPFCCHAHLRAMPRAQLAAVARAFNARLPRAMAVSTRRDIEVLVGLCKPAVPGAPRAVRSRTVVMGSAPGEPESPGPRSPRSPLAGRNRSAGLGTPGGLHVLVEEDEETTLPGTRKSPDDTPTRARAQIARRKRSRTVPADDEERLAFTFDPSFVACAPRYRPRRQSLIGGADLELPFVSRDSSPVACSTPYRGRTGRLRKGEGEGVSFSLRGVGLSDSDSGEECFDSMARM